METRHFQKVVLSMKLFLSLQSFICHIVNIRVWEYVFTSVVIKIKIFQSCCTRVVRVALVSRMCCTRVPLVLLVSHSCHQWCHTCVAFVSLVCGSRVVNQARSFFYSFPSKNFVFNHCHFFFEKVSNFRNRIITNQKTELVIKICQWNCMQRQIFEKYKLNLKMSHPSQATSRTRNLRSYSPKMRNALHYHINSSENLNRFKAIIKYQDGNHCTCKVWEHTRGGSRYFEKRWHSMLATMVDRRRKFQASDGLKRPK